MAPTIIQNTIEVSHNLGSFGDSGTLVLTQDACPQPVGILLSQNSTVDIVQEISPVVEALQTAGNYSSLSLVSSGCTPASSQIAANSTYDPDVAAALTAIPNLQSWITSNNIPFVIGIGVDMSTDPARLDVTADDGTLQGTLPITDAVDVQIWLQIDGLSDPNSPTGFSYDGIPVEVSTIQEFDETGSLDY